MIAPVGASSIDIYEAVLALSRSISRRSCLGDLLSGVAECLQRIVAFDVAALILRESNSMRYYGLDAAAPADVGAAKSFPVELDPAAWAWAHQQPVVIPWLEAELRWPEFREWAMTEGLHSITLVPLTAGENRLGAFGFGCRTCFAPRGEELAFLGVPDAMRHMIEAQIDHLTTEEQRVLEAASVAGVRFSANALAAALQRDTALVEETLEALSRRSRMVHAAGAQQLDSDGISQGYEFVHALYREVFYGRLTPARRAWIRRRIEESVHEPLREVIEITAAHMAQGSGCSDLTIETGHPGRIRTAEMAFA